MPDDRQERAINSADSEDYGCFTGPQRLDKSLHTLEGLLQGIAADGVVTEKELSRVRSWVRTHSEHARRHPFNEIIPFLDQILADGVIDQEEARDVLWLCERLTTPNNYFEAITADLQRLQGMLGGITSDGQITREELDSLTKWMDEHEHLKSCWPYDELGSLILAVLKDGQVSQSEHTMLLALFGEFAERGYHRAVNLPINEMVGPISGFCAVCPEVEFAGRLFCFTGRSERATRRKLVETVEQLGGAFLPAVRKDLNYLIIGADGNPAWAFACYGRKVEQAMEYRKQGLQIVLVHENDFWDSVADRTGC